ncbi:MAG: Ger(x)C family spore germination protein [Oscillospiraceae bacterium]|jgi:spore germination protein KC|nr:Ger(x)C family spore germination protein [Oscillospiraceae bacterium]
MKRLIYLLFAICTLLTVLSSCWSASEINGLALLMGVGIDAAEDGQYKIIGQFANAANFGADASGKAYTNLTQVGDGIQTPLRDLGNMLSRKLYTGHAQVITIGREAAENGMRDILDYFCRSSDARYSIPLFVADNTAEELYELEPKIEAMPVTVLTNLLTAQKYNTMCAKSTIADFISALLSSTTAPTLPLIGVDKDNVHAVLRGAAVFKDDRMIGTLSAYQARAMLVITGEYNGGTHEVRTPDGGVVDLRIIMTQTNVTPKYENGEFSINITAKFRCTLSSVTSGDEYYKSDKRRELEEQANASFQSELENVVNVSQGLNACVFGFGEDIYKKYPRESKELIENWDEYYPNLKVTYKIETILDSTGAISEKIEQRNRGS